jgi:hypothetical protein
MNSSTLNYRLPSFTGLISHSPLRTLFVRDTADEEQLSLADLALEAQVRSGDYFITLATTLDQLGKETTDYRVRLGIEDAVSDLIYLQDHYRITKEKASQ